MTNPGALPSRVIARRAQARRGNLKQAVTNPPGPSYDAAVYREIAPQGHFPALRAQGATAPAEPRNDKSGSASLPCHCEEGASPTWQSQAGSDESAGGFPVFRPVLRDCRALLRKARNDKSRAFTVLTIVCQFRRYSAGPGCPLPYNITSHCKRAGRAVRPFSILLFHFHSAQDIDGAHAHAEVPALGIGVKIQVDLIALDAAADVLGHAVAIDILAVV